MHSSVRNKSNCRRQAGKTIAKAGGLDAATPEGDKRAKQSQFGPETGPRESRQGNRPGSRGDESCQTKPIRPEAANRASPVGKRICGELYMRRPMAKQSQFPALPDGAAPGDGGLYKQSQSPRETEASRKTLGHIAPNKANWPRLSVAEDPVTMPAARIL